MGISAVGSCVTFSNYRYARTHAQFTNYLKYSRFRRAVGPIAFSPRRHKRRGDDKGESEDSQRGKWGGTAQTNVCCCKLTDPLSPTPFDLVSLANKLSTCCFKKKQKPSFVFPLFGPTHPAKNMAHLRRHGMNQQTPQPVASPDIN